jgi:hypothetical protein
MAIVREHVEPVDLGVRWEPNAADPLLVQRQGKAILVAPPHFDDADQRRVGFVVTGCYGVWLGPPNDEGISAHRLYDLGLRECVWAGEVFDSSWISTWKERVQEYWHWSAPFDPAPYYSLRHWILLFKESTAECFGTELNVARLKGDTQLMSLLKKVE